MARKENFTAKVLVEKKSEILEEWTRAQMDRGALREDLMSLEDLRSQSEEFLNEFVEAINSGNLEDASAPEFGAINQMLAEIAMNRAKTGFSPRETGNYILSLKDALSKFFLDQSLVKPEGLYNELSPYYKLIDSMAIRTFEVFIIGRDELIRRQQEEILELSTPVIQIWQGALVVPLIGTLDSARTQVVMKNLLQEIVGTTAQVVILDISGVPTVDTLTAQHLLKTIAAARLMGSQCIISGIRPAIAETIVNLGIDLSEVKTSANLSGALKEVFGLLNLDVVERKRM